MVVCLLPRNLTISGTIHLIYISAPSLILKALCAKKNILIKKRRFAAEHFADKFLKGILPNLFSDTAIYLLSK
jgi:hypothetical protein